ncbi:hypothetical protein [Patulibacter sp.]|uniref:hypothetical protein n=1 Tax=Patulibacter sp. TaxID=1912859 RepID=UPI00272177CA|nr:hypothetical protein [Patulibacter sp.]MDO9407452.1 hypothetical protein [Patulibacter sp.]
MFSLEKLNRYWFPGVILVACFVVYALSPDETGLEVIAVLFGGGAAIVVVNYIQRVGFAGDVERDKEAEVRAFYSRYGMWPGQASPELLAQARSEGMLEHVVLPPRPAPRAGAGSR